MRTEKQILASRENGKKSRGPVTPEGKLRSARNSLRHGMLARTVVLDSESEDRFNELFKSLCDQLKPVTVIEELLVQKMAVAHWRQMRFWMIEKAGMDLEVATQSAEHSGNPLSRRNLGSVGQTASQFEVRFDRQFDRALARFERLRQHPIQMPNA